MNTNDEKDIKYEEKRKFITNLKALREMTRLDPIAYVKVLRARREAENLRDVYARYEPSDKVAVDYSDANDLEYMLRKRSLERSVQSDWLDYLRVEHDGYGLSEFADDCIRTHIAQKKLTRHK